MGRERERIWENLSMVFSLGVEPFHGVYLGSVCSQPLGMQWGGGGPQPGLWLGATGGFVEVTSHKAGCPKATTTTCPSHCWMCDSGSSPSLGALFSC